MEESLKLNIKTLIENLGLARSIDELFEDSLRKLNILFDIPVHCRFAAMNVEGL